MFVSVCVCVIISTRGRRPCFHLILLALFRASKAFLRKKTVYSVECSCHWQSPHPCGYFKKLCQILAVYKGFALVIQTWLFPCLPFRSKARKSASPEVWLALELQEIYDHETWLLKQFYSSTDHLFCGQWYLSFVISICFLLKMYNFAILFVAVDNAFLFRMLILSSSNEMYHQYNVNFEKNISNQYLTGNERIWQYINYTAEYMTLF